jgi:hypothetical protein
MNQKQFFATFFHKASKDKKNSTNGHESQNDFGLVKIIGNANRIGGHLMKDSASERKLLSRVLNPMNWAAGVHVSKSTERRRPLDVMINKFVAFKIS